MKQKSLHNTDTLLTATEFLDKNEWQHILNVTPAEGNRPLSILRDTYSEELANPGMFLGQKRPEIKDRLTKVHHSDICKSDLSRSERRSAMWPCVLKIFSMKQKSCKNLIITVTSSTQKMQGKQQIPKSRVFETARNIKQFNPS